MSQSYSKVYFTKDELNTTNVERNMGLVYYIAKRYTETQESNTREPFEDLVSIGTIGLIKAVNTFDASKGFKFATYATRCINNEILMNFRRNKKKRQEISMQTPIHVDDNGNVMTIENTIDEKIDMNQEDDSRLQEMLDCLPMVEDKRNRNILLLFLAGKRQKEIARIMGISQSYISRLQQNAIEEIRRKMKAIPLKEGEFSIKVQDKILVVTIKGRKEKYTFYKDEQGYYEIYNLVK